MLPHDTGNGPRRQSDYRIRSVSRRHRVPLSFRNADSAASSSLGNERPGRGKEGGHATYLGARRPLLIANCTVSVGRSASETTTPSSVLHRPNPIRPLKYIFSRHHSLTCGGATFQRSPKEGNLRISCMAVAATYLGREQRTTATDGGREPINATRATESDDGGATADAGRKTWKRRHALNEPANERCHRRRKLKVKQAAAAV